MIRRLLGKLYTWIGLAFIVYPCVRVILELSGRLPHDPSLPLLTLMLLVLGGGLILLASRQVRP
ncbi:MAG TPA: hypothetical protein VIZ18_00495 [Ktedonobacteraceae bacterium]